MFNVYALSASAEAAPAKVVTAAQSLSVHDIVPNEYFSKYAGKFNSYEEVAQANGFSTANPAQGTQGLRNASSANGYVKVNSVDEYAALLNYYNDLTSSIQNAVEHQSSSVKALADYETRTVTHEKTWNDTGVTWMKAYVICEVNNKTDKIVGTPRTDSAYFGFHPGTSWEHSKERSSVHVNTEKTGGYANIVGTMSFYIIIEGIGKVTEKELTKYMTF
ncbi:hypothetical protein M3650_02905 [Paenibacillus sp. MER TA 81-3]|uniref:hypothetical protein n=1 Tax=Paenibacillus sp. MER TA 81-3 TaxID=2939573 RepID=UPI00203D5451|nr:hypothetical protein [Paenibacillus sp. MER TA 81-3]MCM3337618.1 hypothetical protein [Paenibacillus sp. MER TA 81-3]